MLSSNSGTETASENGDNTADLSNLCETVLITSDPADSSTEINKSTDDCSKFCSLIFTDSFFSASFEGSCGKKLGFRFYNKFNKLA